MFCFERVLFVVGYPDSGKSTVLRGLLRDPRLGTDGKIPKSKKIKEFYRIGENRGLYLRLTSPHERRETLGRFLRKTRRKIEGQLTASLHRWNFAGALQPWKAGKMPDAEETIGAFRSNFSPERIRVALLWPNQVSIEDPQEVREVRRFLRAMRRLGSIETLLLDNQRSKNDSVATNGMMLADYFDFT